MPGFEMGVPINSPPAAKAADRVTIVNGLVRLHVCIEWVWEYISKSRRAKHGDDASLNKPRPCTHHAARTYTRAVGNSDQRRGWT